MIKKPNEPNDEGFSYLAEPVLALVRQPRTKGNLSELLGVLHPVIDYYIKYYLYEFGLYDTHPDHDDAYGDTYRNVIDLLNKIEPVRGGELTEFNRVKRYLNKSISGWLYNRIYKKRKRMVEMTKNEVYLMFYPDQKCQALEVEYTIDLETVKAHIDKELGFYFELYGTLFGSEAARKRRKLAEKQYRDAVYLQFHQTGKLMDAVDFFEMKFGRMFEQAECHI